MKTHAEIIEALGVRAIARQLDHSNPTTVQGWRTRNRIPQEHWADVILASEKIAAADTGKAAITLNDLLPEELRAA